MNQQKPQSLLTGKRLAWALGLLALAAVLIYVALFNPRNIIGSLFGGSQAPSVSILQPTGPSNLASGQGLVVLAEANATGGLHRVLFLVDGKLKDERVFAEGTRSAQAAFAWFADASGAHELSVVAYDANGQFSAASGISVQVAPADRAALVEDAVVFAEGDDPAADGEQARRAEQAGLPAGGGLPNADAPEAADQDADGDAGAEEVAPPAANDEAAANAGENQPDAGADQAPPSADLIVNVERLQGALVANIIANGSDDLGLDFLRVSISGPDGEIEVRIFSCQGAVECGFSFSYALWSSGEWVFHLQAFDLVPQASNAALTTRQIICQEENNLVECSIVERHDPLGEILEEIIRNQSPIWEELLNGVQIDPFDIMAGFAAGGEQAPPERAPDESFELRGCLIVQPVHANNPPNGPVTECPEYDLNSVDLAGIDLRGADFERTDFRSANLRSAKLLWARLFGTDLRGADLTNAQIGRAEARLALFSEATLNGASLNDAFLSGAIMQNIVGAHLEFSRSVMIGTDLRGASLPSATFNGSNLSGADLSGATLEQASFVGANLEGANLLGADLRNADFTNANLFRANFRPANGQIPAGMVNGVVWNNTTCPDGSNSDDNGGQCTVANLAPYAIAGCAIVIDNQYPDGPASDCSGLDMTAADFEGRDLRGADFTGTNLQAADMHEGDFRFANFTNANLLGAQAFGAIFGDNVWSNTVCPDGSNSDNHGNTCIGFLFP